MCAITGYCAFRNKRPEINVLKELLIASESRGRDATGYAFVQNNSLVVRKEPVPASVFTEGFNLDELPKIMIMHCRQATQGHPQDQANNHPLFSKSGLAVVHNGIIYNDNELFQRFGFKRDGQVDSEIILKIIEKAGSFQDLRLLDEIEGGFTFAAVWTRFPCQLLLVKHDNPLAIALDLAEDVLYFASSVDILKASLPKRNYRGFAFLEQSRFLFSDLANDTGLVIGQSGLLRKFNIQPRPCYRNSWQQGPYGAEIDGCEFCGKAGKFIEEYEIFLCEECLKVHRDWYKDYEEDGKNGVLPLR